MKASPRIPVPDMEKCIGCRACSSACPEKLISLSETGKLRRISFPAKCSFECELCALTCPEKAISFVFPETIVPGNSKTTDLAEEKEKSLLPLENQTLELELVPCQKCGAAFATAKELEKIKALISEKLPLATSVDIWIKLCPGCRQEAFREKQAEAIIQARRI